jgi:hypothetical protein
MAMAETSRLNGETVHEDDDESSVGAAAGFAVGIPISEDGALVGALVGAIVSFADGSEIEGVRLGRSDGMLDGLGVGASASDGDVVVGLEVGTGVVGLEVGTGVVGLGVGTSVGDAVGLGVVGLGVGTFVGDAVGLGDATHSVIGSLS